jgi:serine/threonine-protein kinase RsbW
VIVPGTPAARAASTGPENGRGLLLVAALAAQWGWTEVPGGKTVWAALRA